MARARRTCSDHSDGRNCPRLATKGPHCDTHAEAAEKARGSRQQRGYDVDYDRERLRIAREMMAGKVFVCWRCREPVEPGSDWHLGHDDRRRIKGPEHATCNLTAAKRRTPPTTS